MSLEEIYNLFLQFPSVATDTRTLKQNDIYFALKGPNFNGNNFIEAAFKNGASFCITDEIPKFANDKIIKVDDVLETLQQLSLYHRRKLNIPFLAITGTNGKTTTKELIHQVLSKKFKTYTTEGNLNNHIGIPLTILKIKADAQIAVIEMGANHIGEIKSYCKIVEPTHGLITNCGSAHLEGFGSVEGVKKGKGELYDFLAENNGIAFINKGLIYLIGMSEKIRNKIFYGKGTEFSGIAIENEIELKIQLKNSGIIKTNLVGDYNLDNVLAAYTIGEYFKIDEEEIISALESYKPSNNRSQLLEWNSNKIILDAYNANPSSMQAAIKNFGKLDSAEKALVLGGMKELGNDSIQEHENLINLINNFKWNFVVLVGDEFKNLMPEAKHFNNSDEAGTWLSQHQPKNLSILIKGSRSNKMEKVLDN